MAKTPRNNRNAESFLYKALTRLFSGPIVNYRAPTPKNLKRNALDKYKFKSATGLPFKKSNYSPFDQLYGKKAQNAARAERYVDFDQMEHDPIMATVLDIYAYEMTVATEMSKVINIICENDEIREILDNLFFDVLAVDKNIYGWCRDVCKYGDLFLYLDIDDEMGITAAIGLPAEEIERLEGEDKTNPNYVQFQWNSAGMTFENWQVAHFRIIRNRKFDPYGTAILDPARRAWRQLDLQINAMMSYRIVRSPERRVFYVDVGGIDEEDIEQYIEKVKTDMKKNMVIDQDSGMADIRYNAFSTEEDYIIPVYGNNSGTKIENLPGGQYTGDIDDVNFLQDRVLAAVKIPRSYILEGKEAGGNEDKTTLSQKDIRFARVITNLQNTITQELIKIGQVHLYALGFRGKDLVSFDIRMNNPSKIAELQELELWKSRFDAAQAATEGFFSRSWVYKRILKLSDKEIERIHREMPFDKKFEGFLEKLVQTQTEDELGGELGLEGGDTEGSDEEETLLAAPGKRHDRPHTTPGSKGKIYTPVESDKRSIGARKRHMLGMGSRELSRNTPRNILPGYSNLTSLSKGIAEEEKHIYERDLLQTSKELKTMLDTLENSRLNKKDKTLLENKDDEE